MKGLALVLVLLPLAASAATITVNSTADNTLAADGQCTLREAIANVNAAAETTGGDCTAGTGAGDTIVFSVILPATITLSALTELAISSDVTISGPGEGLLALDGNGGVEVFDITAGAVNISNLTIRNGQGSEGGGIYNDARLTLTNCTLSGNVADSVGGGIYNDIDGTAILTACTLGGNAAADDSFNRRDGGGIYNKGILALTACRLTGNTAHGDGGGVYNDGTVTLTDCTLSGNGFIWNDGGGVYNGSHGTATLASCILFANSADRGSGIFNDGTAIVTGCTLAGNAAAGAGGGVYNDVHGALTLTDSTFVGNTGDDDGGGAVYNDGAATLTNCTLSFNSVEYGGGGGVANARTMTLTDCTLFGNSANASGGGLRNDKGGTVTLTNCSLSSNSVGPFGAGSGGGIANYEGTAILANCTLFGNSVAGDGQGGGVSNGYGGTLTLTDCTVSGNSSSEGGGVANYQDGTALLTNCTLFGNSARDYRGGGGAGGGVYNGDGGTLTLTNCTVSGNSASFSEGGNVYSDTYYDGSTALANTIVANSLSGGNCAGYPIAAVADGGHNIDSDGTCGIGPATDPLLDPAGVASNGGATQTIALQAGSPAINAGDNAICAAPPVDGLDQRGVIRPATGSINCSIGAYEYEPPSPLTPTSSATNTPTPTATGASTITVNSTADDTTAGDGQCTLREAIANVIARADTSSGDCAAGSGTGDTIVFGFFLPAKITLTTALTISTDVTIAGPGEGLLALDGNGAVGVFDITSGTVSIANLTIQNGSAGGRSPSQGGGVHNSGTLTLSNCTLSGNSGDGGGGVYNDGMLTVDSCTLSSNAAGDFAGGGVYNDINGTARLTNCALGSNSADGGGGIYNKGRMTVANCRLFGNTGGGVANDGTLTMTDCTLTGNSAVFVDGGGVYNGSDGLAMLINCTMIANYSPFSGGGVENIGTLTLGNCTLSGNTSGNGGGINNTGTLAVRSSTLTGNAANEGHGGGAVHNSGEGRATLTDCTLSFNSVNDGYGGGGVDNSGTMTLTNCTLFGNSTDNDGGGGIYNEGIVALTNCTLNGNSASQGAGGGVNNQDGTAILTNCTLFGNSAGGGSYPGGGGGVSNVEGGTVTLTNCTLSGNSAANGTGGNLSYGYYGVDGATTLANTILTDSLGGGNCAGKIVGDLGHNIDSDGTCRFGPATDPLLDPAGPANNGGPTLTIALQAGSPAINAGDESVCSGPLVNSLDQRGALRPGLGATTCSIGAYEYDAPIPTPTVAPTLPPSIPICATASEGNYLVLSCPNGIIVAIDFASYGRPQGSCGSFKQGSCSAFTSTAVVARACVGQAECVLYVENQTFGYEPCLDTAKELAVQAECSLLVPSPTATSTALPTFTPIQTLTELPAVTPTPTSTPLPCTGDCDGDHHVDVSEIVLMVDIALGNQPASWCRAGDADKSTTIEITEIIAAIRHALSGCPGT